MVVAATLAACLSISALQAGIEPTMPAWAGTGWSNPDPFAHAWEPYAAALAKNPGYLANSPWGDRAKRLVGELEKQPVTATALYKAAATYLVARELDWKFEFDPTMSLEIRNDSTPTYGKLYRALVHFKVKVSSREFSRLAFVFCAASSEFEAGNLQDALLRAYPNDRLVISASVWYEHSRHDGAHGTRSAAKLAQAKRLLELPSSRPHDYLTLATAFACHFWATKDIADSIGYRDALIAFKGKAPADFAKCADKDLKNVEGYIKRHNQG